MQLPQSLAPWSSYLTLLASPLPWSLGPTIKCLELVLGPSRVALAAESDDEPEGYDGIARKGTYERLVLSEWLLADEYPDEFLRRSSVGEHAFLELSRRSPAGKKKTTLLFDCGPNQLGSPRIAHLAILIVLARRAEINGMDVEWGVLQDAGNTLVKGVSRTSIEKLLSSGTVHEVTSKDIDRWFELVADQDVVIVGGARLSRMTRKRKATLLTIEDILEPGERALAASYSASQGNRRSQFNLPLPPESDCTKLLHDPFDETLSVEVEKQKQKQSAPEWSLIASGEYFLLRKSADCVLSLRVPRTARSRGLRQRTYSLRDGGELLASGANIASSAMAMFACSTRFQYQIVLIGGTRQPSYHMHQLHTSDRFDQQSKPFDKGMSAILPSPRKDDKNEYLWIQTGDRILEVPSRAGSSVPNMIAEDVLWLTRSHGTLNGIKQDVLVYATERQNRYQVKLVGLDTSESEELAIPYRPMFCSSSELLIAYRDERLRCWSFASYPPSIAVTDSIHDRQFLHGEIPIAIVTAGQFGTSMTSLLTISKDQRDLHVVSSGGMTRMRLPQATSTIRSFAISQSGVVAFITDRVLTLVWPDCEWQPFVFDGQRFGGQWEGG